MSRNEHLKRLKPLMLCLRKTWKNSPKTAIDIYLSIQDWFGI